MWRDEAYAGMATAAMAAISSLLLILSMLAMLRAAGIPARLRWVKAQSAVLHHLVAGSVYRGMPATSSHFWPECYLEGRWLSCEALLDKLLYEGMPPAWLEKLIAPFFYPFNLRYTERIRRRAGDRSQAINRGG